MLAGGAEHERVGPVLVLPGNARCGPAGFDRVARHARPVVGEAFFFSHSLCQNSQEVPWSRRVLQLSLVYTLYSLLCRTLRAVCELSREENYSILINTIKFIVREIYCEKKPK